MPLSTYRMTVFQHAIDQSGEPVSHVAVMAFGPPSLVRARTGAETAPSGDGHRGAENPDASGA